MTRRRSGSFCLADQSEYLSTNEIQIKNGPLEAYLDFSVVPMKDSLRAAMRDEGYTKPSPI